MMNVFMAPKSASSIKQLGSSIPDADFAIVNEQAAFRPYSSLLTLKMPFTNGNVFPVIDNTSFHSFVVNKIAADARAVVAVLELRTTDAAADRAAVQIIAVHLDSPRRIRSLRLALSALRQCRLPRPSNRHDQGGGQDGRAIHRDGGPHGRA